MLTHRDQYTICFVHAFQVSWSVLMPPFLFFDSPPRRTPEVFFLDDDDDDDDDDDKGLELVDAIKGTAFSPRVLSWYHLKQKNTAANIKALSIPARNATKAKPRYTSGMISTPKRCIIGSPSRPFPWDDDRPGWVANIWPLWFAPCPYEPWGGPLPPDCERPLMLPVRFFDELLWLCLAYALARGSLSGTISPLMIFTIVLKHRERSWI